MGDDKRVIEDVISRDPDNPWRDVISEMRPMKIHHKYLGSNVDEDVDPAWRVMAAQENRSPDYVWTAPKRGTKTIKMAAADLTQYYLEIREIVAYAITAVRFGEPQKKERIYAYWKLPVRLGEELRRELLR